MRWQKEIMNDTQAGTLRTLRNVGGGCVPRDSMVVHQSRNTSCLDSRIAVDCNTARACGRLPVDWTIFTNIISFSDVVSGLQRGYVESRRLKGIAGPSLNGFGKSANFRTC